MIYKNKKSPSAKDFQASQVHIFTNLHTRFVHEVIFLISSIFISVTSSIICELVKTPLSSLLGGSMVILSNELSLQLTPLCSSRIHDHLGTLLFELFAHLYLRVLDRKEEGDVL